MENKYYTPELEEFHVGFEWEIKPSPLMDWESKIVDTNIDLEAIEYHLENNKGIIRVKYLNKEDIEDLGFTKNSKDYQKGLLARNEFIKLE